MIVDATVLFLFVICLYGNAVFVEYTQVVLYSLFRDITIALKFYYDKICLKFFKIVAWKFCLPPLC